MSARNEITSVQEYKALLNQFRVGSVENHESILKHLYKLLQNALALSARSENRLQQQDKEIETLQKLTHVDMVTGLYNRRGIEMMMNREIGLIRHDLASTGTVAHFSILNIQNLIKEFSAEAAGEVELAIADMLKKQFRAFDVVARTGKGEYAVLLPQARKEQVREIHRTIEATLKNFKIVWRGRSLPAFLSVAIATLKEDSSAPEVLNRLLERAHDNDGLEMGSYQVH